MFDFLLWVKALHIISVIFWVAALLMLPRLYAYHSKAKIGGELEEVMVKAERRLLKIIMTPAMAASLFFGVILLVYNFSYFTTSFWIYIKIILLLLMFGYHGFLVKTRKDFLNGGRPKSEVFFRMINEIPAIFTIVIVILVVVKPF